MISDGYAKILQRQPWSFPHKPIMLAVAPVLDCPAFLILPISPLLIFLTLKELLRAFNPVNCCNDLYSVGTSLGFGPLSSANSFSFSIQTSSLWNGDHFSVVGTICSSGMVVFGLK